MPIRQHLPEHVCFDPEAIAAMSKAFDETCIAQDAEVLGDGGLGHAEPAPDFAHGLLRGDEEAENRAAVGFGNDLKGGIHAPRILHRVYTCQGIFKCQSGQRKPAVDFESLVALTGIEPVFQP